MNSCRRSVILVWASANLTLSLVQGGTVHYNPVPQLHQQTVIKNVAPTALTVTTRTLTENDKLVQEQTKAYVITRFTEITVNGQRATLAQLKPGMRVSVTLGSDPLTAARIVANG
jgi:hypothetical protein